VTIHDDQAARLRATIEWARKLRATLGPLQRDHGDRVHFRPASTSVAMVGLLADRPQRGKSGITNLDRVAADFETMFVKSCRDVDHGRFTGEKALQSFLIREAYAHERRMVSINTASSKSDDPVDLWFITDEIALPIETGKTVCDVLALRRDNGRSIPVLLELKDARQLRRLVEQVNGYAHLIDEHATLFAELFAAILGEPVRFDRPTEKWIVWPAGGDARDRKEDELCAHAIRVVGYTEAEAGYRFRVGKGVEGSPL
jgi:hypothetical protein